MTKLDAIKYLVKNSAYGDEWSGAGMWEAVTKVMAAKNDVSKTYLDELLVRAKHF